MYHMLEAFLVSFRWRRILHRKKRSPNYSKADALRYANQGLAPS